MFFDLDSAFLDLILNASLLVQLVMLLLLFMSLFSWYLIFSKSRELTVAKREAYQFEEEFWHTQNLSKLYASLQEESETQGMAVLFQVGYSEFIKLRKLSAMPPADMVSGAQRAMKVAINREADALENNLSTLATIGSISPYIGLFGTVWGIMHSFQALGDVQQATLAMVAPGISEALIATALGLFAAIPAVMAYNQAVTNIDRLLNQYEGFTDDFCGLLQRQAYQLSAAHKAQK